MEPLLSGLSAFFPWLINYTIDISILICLMFIIKSVTTKRLPAWWHYSLWIILLFRMIFPCKFECSPLNITSVVPITIDETLFDTILVEEEIAASNFTPEISSSLQGWNIQVDELSLFLWFAGVITFGIFILVKNIRFQNEIKKEPLLTDKKVLCLLEECKHRMKIGTALKITVTDKIKSPALFGYIRPRLLLPAGVLEKHGCDELSYIFMHELGHLKRHDIGVSWIMTFLQIFQWFNPLVWVAFHQMRIDQESACDALVLSRIKHKHSIDYASTIVGFLEKFCQNRKLPAMVGILENQAQIKKRITMIVNNRKYSKTMMLFSTMLLILIGVIFFSFFGFANAKHEQSVLDSSILEALTPDISKDLIGQDNTNIHANEVMTATEVISDAQMVSQQGVKNFEIAQEKPENKTEDNLADGQHARLEEEKKEVVTPVEVAKNISAVSREPVLKDEVIQIESVKKHDKVLADVQNTNAKGEKKSVRSAGNVKNTVTASQAGVVNYEPVLATAHSDEGKKILAEQEANIKDEKSAEGITKGVEKESAGALKLAKEVINPSKDIKTNYQAVELGNKQLNEMATLSPKVNSPREKTDLNYLGLAGVVHYMQENTQVPEENHDITENIPDDSKIHDIKEYDEQPRIVNYYPPEYPHRAKEKGIEGRVLLRFIVDKTGHVQDPQVISAEPEGVFEQAALDNVVKYKLKPAKKDGASVSSVVRLAISFSLRDNYLRFAQR